MLLDFLESIRCGGILLDSAGATIELNATAHRILQENAGVRFQAGDAAQARQSLELMVNRDMRQMREERPFVVRRNDQKWPIIVSVLEPGTSEPRTKAVILLDLNLRSDLDGVAIQKAFGLTAAESNLAVGLARGSTLTEIARAQGVSMNTVRGHLAATFSKTNTRRQAELSALLARFSLISC